MRSAEMSHIAKKGEITMNRIENKPFCMAMFALIAITGQVFGIYQVPEGYDIWVNAVLALMTAAGIFVDPTTPGFKDK